MSLSIEITPQLDSAYDPASELVNPGLAAILDQQVTEIFKQFRDSVYRHLVAVLKNPWTAEEITQEAFLRLCGCLRDGQVSASVRARVFRVAHNLARNENASSLGRSIRVGLYLASVVRS